MFKKFVIMFLACVLFISSATYAGTVIITDRRTTSWGNYRVVMLTAVFSGTHGTGFTFAPATIGLRTVKQIFMTPTALSADEGKFKPIYSSGVVKFYQADTTATIVATAREINCTYNVLAVGR